MQTIAPRGDPCSSFPPTRNNSSRSNHSIVLAGVNVKGRERRRGGNAAGMIGRRGRGLKLEWDGMGWCCVSISNY